MSLKIAIVAQLNHAKYGELHTSIDNNWFEFLTNINCSVHVIPNHFKSAKKVLATLKPDAFILTGGGFFSFDIENDPRSEIETFILNNYQRSSILGVCRGMQAMHLLSGGTLKEVSGHVKKQFPITFEGKTVSQNSYHNQGFYSCTDEFIPLAIAEDGVIKAMKHKQYNWLGIMWHPERPPNDMAFNISLINAFFSKEK